MANQSFEKCFIINVDEPQNQIQAQYNPNKVSIGKNVLWHKHPSSAGTADMLEFGNAKNRTLSVELFFDGIEGDNSQTGRQQPVNVETKYVEPLISMTVPDKERPTGDGGELAWRPPLVMIAWGRMKKFRGVIDSLNYDFSMFLPSGIPVRATVTLKITEIDMLQLLKPQKKTQKLSDVVNRAMRRR